MLIAKLTALPASVCLVCASVRLYLCRHSDTFPACVHVVDVDFVTENVAASLFRVNVETFMFVKLIR